MFFVFFRSIGSGWIGLDDRKTEGLFAWANGKPVKFTNWGTDEPNAQSAASNCVELIAGDKYGLSYDGTWNDEICTKFFQYICEIPEASLGTLIDVMLYLLT